MEEMTSSSSCPGPVVDQTTPDICVGVGGAITIHEHMQHTMNNGDNASYYETTIHYNNTTHTLQCHWAGVDTS